MQTVSKTIKNSIVITGALTLIAVIARIILMLVGFDSNTLFYKNDLWATLLYIFVLASAVAVFLSTKNITTHKSVGGTSVIILNLMSVLVAIGLLITKCLSTVPEMAISRVTHWGAIFALVISVIFFILKAGKNGQRHTVLITLLNLAPVIYIICQLIDCFTSVSIRANSYYLFPDILSLLTLAFYVLYEGKIATVSSNEKGVPMFSYSLLMVYLVLFSAIPDFAVQINLTVTSVLLSVLKLIYATFAIIVIIKTLNTKAEEQK